MIKAVESADSYPPTESSLCRWCDYQDICPLFAHLYKTESLPPNEYLKEEGVSLVNKYAELDIKKKELNSQVNEIEAEQDKLEEAIITKAEQEGVTKFYGSDRVAKVNEDIKIDYPKSKDPNRNAFAHALNEMGLWDAVTDVTWTSLKKVAKGEGWDKKVPDDLSPFINIEPIKNVRLSKRKDGE